MQINSLMRLVADSYESDIDVVDGYWDFKKARIRPRPNRQDTLAEFIVRELHDTFNSNHTTRYQLQEASAKLGVAVLQLNGVIEKLDQFRLDPKLRGSLK